MLFSSIAFLFYFLPVFLLGYFFTRFRNGFLLAASLYFYAYGEIGYVGLIILSSLMNYYFGKLISSGRHRARLFLWSGIILNLCVISIFKYWAFLCESLNVVLGLIHLPLLPVYTIPLPLGISFFTFQAMSYLVDVYRDDAPVEKNPLDLMLYITMFPQLIAGPIVRFKTIYREIRDRNTTSRLFVDGIRYFIIGLSQKVLIANTVALTCDKIFDLSLSSINFSLAWLGAVSFTLQIYYDFAGYSNMAIGLALMIGFHLPENFNYPYASRSVQEFWRRWHMTLSQWFRDYLYIPLGGNRKGRLRTYINLILVFSLCGLWHGASWTFVAWGLFHGFFLVLERMGLGNILKRLPDIVRRFYTLWVVISGWVLFRSETFTQAWVFLKNMIGLGQIAYPEQMVFSIGYYLREDVIIAGVAGIVLSLPVADFLRGRRDSTGAWIPSAGIYLLQCILLLFSIMSIASGAYNPFIYFRF